MTFAAIELSLTWSGSRGSSCCLRTSLVVTKKRDDDVIVFKKENLCTERNITDTEKDERIDVVNTTELTEYHPPP